MVTKAVKNTLVRGLSDLLGSSEVADLYRPGPVVKDAVMKFDSLKGKRIIRP